MPVGVQILHHFAMSERHENETAHVLRRRCPRQLAALLAMRNSDGRTPKVSHCESSIGSAEAKQVPGEIHVLVTLHSDGW